MRVSEVDSDKSNLEHIRRHSVEPYEVEEVLLSRQPHVWRGRGGSHYALGQTAAGRYLFVVCAVRSHGHVYPIAARAMTDREKRRFRRRR